MHRRLCTVTPNGVNARARAARAFAMRNGKAYGALVHCAVAHGCVRRPSSATPYRLPRVCRRLRRRVCPAADKSTDDLSRAGSPSPARAKSTRKIHDFETTELTYITPIMPLATERGPLIDGRSHVLMRVRPTHTAQPRQMCVRNRTERGSQPAAALCRPCSSLTSHRATVAKHSRAPVLDVKDVAPPHRSNLAHEQGGRPRAVHSTSILPTEQLRDAPVKSHLTSGATSCRSPAGRPGRRGIWPRQRRRCAGGRTSASRSSA